MNHTPPKRLRRLPPRGATPAARQSRFRGVHWIGLRHAAAGALVLLLGAMPVTGHALDLLELHERARAQAPSLRQSQARVGEQQAAWRQARAQLLPQADAAWGPQRARGEATQRSSRVTLNQSLLDLQAWRSTTAQASQLAAEEQGLVASEQDLRLQSASLYLQALAAETLAQIQTELEQAYGQEAERMGVRLREGLSAAVDAEQSRAFHRLAQINAQGAQARLGQARASVLAHAGLREWSALQPLPARQLPPALEADTEAGDAPSLRALELQRQAREQALSAERAAPLPTLSLRAETSRIDTGRWDQSARVELSLPLLDGGARSARRDAAAERLKAAEAALEAEQREQRRVLESQRLRLQAARAQAEAATAGEQSAAAALKAMRHGQELGSRSTTDVLLAIQNLGQLRAQGLQAQLEAWLAWLEALHAAGRLDDAALTQLNHALKGA